MQSQGEESTAKVTPVPESQKVEIAGKVTAVEKELPGAQIAHSGNSFTGVQGRIISAYVDGFRATTKTGVTMAPQTTLREYLKNVVPLLRTASVPFTDLTKLTEVALYSNQELDETMASHAEQLANTTKQG